MTVYLDNAATTKIDPKVWKYMQECSQYYGNPSCNHTLGKKALDIVENAKEIIARKINAEPCEIIFMSGGTEANNLAITQANGHIITTAIEHVSVLAACGRNTTFLPVDSKGYIDLDKLQSEIRKGAELVSAGWINNEIGTIQDIAAIAEICNRYGVLLHTDAVAALGHVETDVQKICIGMMSLSAHKIYAPKGVGALYVNKRLDVEPLIIGGRQEFSIRGGTENILGIAGFGKAVEILDHNQQIYTLVNTLREGIQRAFDNVRINTPEIETHVLSVEFEGIDGGWLMQMLSARGIYVSQGSCGNPGHSHVIEAIGGNARQVIRFSFGKFNTMQDVDIILQALIEIVSNV